MALYKIIKVTETKISRLNRVISREWYKITVEKEISIFNIFIYKYDQLFEDDILSLEEADLIIEQEKVLQSNRIALEIVKTYDI